MGPQIPQIPQIETRIRESDGKGCTASRCSSGGAEAAPIGASATAPPLTSGPAGGRLRRAHARWVGANLCHLWSICVICGSAFDLERFRLSLADNRETLLPGIHGNGRGWRLGLSSPSIPAHPRQIDFGLFRELLRSHGNRTACANSIWLRADAHRYG